MANVREEEWLFVGGVLRTNLEMAHHRCGSSCGSLVILDRTEFQPCSLYLPSSSLALFQMELISSGAFVL